MTDQNASEPEKTNRQGQDDELAKLRAEQVALKERLANVRDRLKKLDDETPKKK